MHTPQTSAPPTQDILQQMFTGIIWVHSNLIIDWVNSQTEQLFSVSHSRLVGLSVLDILMPCEAELAIINHTVSTKLDDTGKTVTDTVQIELLKDKLNAQLEKQFINAQQYQQPFIEYGRHIVGVLSPVMINYSVTPVERDGQKFFLIEMWEKNAQNRIDKDQRQQEQHDVAREMLRSVAHEVKNPLAGIRGAAQLLNRHIKRQLNKITPAITRNDYVNEQSLDKLVTQEENNNLLPVDAKKLTTYTNIVISETDRLTDLISQLLGSNQLPNWEPVNIHEPLERVIILTQSQYPIVKIIRDYDLSLPEIIADKNQLIQMFLNLANNACESMLERDSSQLGDDYSPELRFVTRVDRQCTIGSKMHRQVLQVCVTDNGAGIAPEIIDRIFFPMVTGRASGTGLGLALVKDMINRHQGAIDVHSMTGETSFCIYIPFKQDE